MQNCLDSQVSRNIDVWRQHQEVLKRLEQLADQAPAIAAKRLCTTALENYYTSLRHLSRNFGLSFRLRGNRECKVVAPERGPRTLAEDKACSDVIAHCTLWGGAWCEANLAREYAERNNEDPDRAACEAFFYVLRALPPIMSGISMGLKEDTQPMRQRASMSLAGYVGSRISLSINRRLKAALDHEENRTSFENLLETLPGATYAEWSRDRLEDLDDLVRRVALRLEKDEGIEVSKLAHEGKLAAGNSDAEDNEPELERFRAREAAARRLSELTRRARLSPREWEILDLRYRKRLGTRQIAEALGIAENTVYVHERNLKKKLREAADL